jgi:hypothetical protein
LSSYTPKDGAAGASTLTVRDGMQGAPTTIAREKWQLAGNVVTLDGGFEAGRTYELAYTATSAPLSGLGFVAVRDTASWLKSATDAAAPGTKYAYAFGSSQSGRFLRDFLYEGFNTDEKNRQVFDAVIANIAGAARIDLNARGATPIAQAQFTATSFPFADIKQRDPVSGVEEGALENPRARDHQPKDLLHEHRRRCCRAAGDPLRSCILRRTAHGSDAARQRTLLLPDRFAARPGEISPSVTNGQQKENPNDYWFTMRALMVAMDEVGARSGGAAGQSISAARGRHARALDRGGVPEACRPSPRRAR